MKLLIIGRGKVGSTLALHARRAGGEVQLVSARRVLLQRSIRWRADRELIVIASRDDDIAQVAASLARHAPTGPVVHCAGALGPEVLAPLRVRGAAHPLVSFASTATDIPAGAALVIEGPIAVQRAAKRLAKLVGLRPVVVRAVDRARYHLAAALVANGAVALAGAGQALLMQACPDLSPKIAGTLLGALLTSVGQNTARIGPAAALTGPVRRGDLTTIERHLAALATQPKRGSSRNRLVALYRALVLEQARLVSSLPGVSKDLVQRLSLIEQSVAQRS